MGTWPNLDRYYLILVRPKLPVNVGAAARAMANLGFQNLRIVGTGKKVVCEEARAVAKSGACLIDEAKQFDTVDAAIEDLNVVLATTVRVRSVSRKVLFSHELKPFPYTDKVGVLFGPEDFGLSNEDIVQADAMITVASKTGSMNVSHALALVCYDIARNSMESMPCAAKPTVMVTKKDLAPLFSFVESKIGADGASFQGKLQFHCYAFRNLINDKRLTQQELNTLFGVLKVISKTAESKLPG